MAIRSREQYLEGLRDGRRVHYQGRQIDDVLAEPDLRKAAERSAVAFDTQHDPAHRDLAADVSEGRRSSIVG